MRLDPKTWWYVTRATGFVAWALLALSVLWGLFISTKPFQRSATPPAWLLDLHRHLGGLSVVFVAVHVAVLPLDTFTDWGWKDLAVPGASRWEPLATAFGIVAVYLLVAIEITSLLGRRIPRAWWRRVHVLSFPLYVLATIHLFAAGTDATNPIALGVVFVVTSLVGFLTVVRALAVFRPRPEPARAARIPAAARSEARGDGDAPRSAATVIPPAGCPPTPSVPAPAPAATAPIPPPKPGNLPAPTESARPVRVRQLSTDARVAKLRERSQVAAARYARTPREGLAPEAVESAGAAAG